LLGCQDTGEGNFFVSTKTVVMYAVFLLLLLLYMKGKVLVKWMGERVWGEVEGRSEETDETDVMYVQFRGTFSSYD
jgi:hypothetical protein